MSDQKKRRGNPASRGRSGSGELPQQPRSNNQNQNRSNSKMNQHQGQNKFQRQTSYDHVRNIVRAEGRAARNLITWSVPVDDEEQKMTYSNEKNHHRSYYKGRRAHSASGPRSHQQSHQNYTESTPDPKTARPKSLNMDNSGGLSEIPSAKGKESPESSQLNSSQGSAGTPRKDRDLRARYWAFLFENLRRAVDEIYQTCEADESVVECKEVIMMLEQCTKDFKSLIERHKLLKAYEAADEDSKPTSLAWEVRKSSPGKALGNSGSGKDFIPSPSVSRSLNFSGPPQVQRQPLGNSWADRVKGIVPKPNIPPPMPLREQTETSSLNLQPKSDSTGPPVSQALPNEMDGYREQIEDDSEGWEVVHHNSRTKRPLSGGIKSQNVNQNHSKSSNSSMEIQRAISTDSTLSKSSKHGSTRDENYANTTMTRQRTSSHDSEKENQPWSGGGKIENVNNSAPWGQEKTAPMKIQDLDDPSILAKGPSISPETHHLLPQLESPQAVVDTNNSPVDVVCVASEELVLSDEDDDEMELENALASALDAEENLSSELEKEQQMALQSAIEEEESYLKEIAREESMELEMEAESESDLGNTASTSALESSLPMPVDWESMMNQYDAEADYRSTTSWGDMVEDTDARTPGRVVHMHEKLSSPSRKRSLKESLKRFEEKQAKAQELREKLQQEKSERLRMLTNKVEEVRAWKDELLQQRRETIERKLQHAEEKRQLQLKQKVKKAHEEENKANEIAFINSLEAQNKRHDIFTKYQEHEVRLQDIQEERQRRHEEKLAKEAAVEERRKALHAERQTRLQEMQERRRHREEVIEQRQQEKDKERQETARAKERDREERIAALNAQQQAHIEELQKKIQQKQEDSGRRKQEQLEHIQEKAFSMTILRHSTEDHIEAPKLVPFETQKFCTACNVLIPSEVHLSSHLRGKKHQQSITDSIGKKDLTKEEIESFNLKHISDAPSDKPDPRVASDRERQKAMKKRCKKLRQRMLQRGTEYESTLSGKQPALDSEHKAKLQKIIKDLTKYLQVQDKGPWPQNKVSALERGLGEIGRILDKKLSVEQNTFRVSGGLTTLSRVLLVIGDSTANLPPVIPAKSLIHCCAVFRLVCKGCYENCHCMLFSNKAGSLVDLLSHQLNLLIPDNLGMDLSSSTGASNLRLPNDPLVTSLMQLIATVLSVLAKHNPTVNSSEASVERMSTWGDAFMSRANDIVSYIISVGILDRLTQYFNNVRGPIDKLPQVGEFLQHSMGLLIAMIRIISKRNVNIFDTCKRDDTTQLISTFEVTGLVGIVSLMYGMLLHSGTPPRGDAPPPELPSHSLSVATVGFRMLNHLATLDLHLLQSSLGEEGTSLEFRHISSYLLWYCSHWNHEELLYEVILCVGYFTVLNNDNQVIIQSGQPPTVLQQLCSLPFQYFSDPKLTCILFPTLITCCYSNPRNREILEQELSCALLANFIEEKGLEAQTNKSPVVTKKLKNLEKEPDLRMAFGCRFPQEQWAEAETYFKLEK